MGINQLPDDLHKRFELQSSCVERELPSISYLNNLERFNFVIFRHTKDLLHRSKHDLSRVEEIYQNVIYFAAKI